METKKNIDKKNFGRPPTYGKKMRQTAIYLPDEILEWIAKQPGDSMSDIIRNIIETNMNMRHK